MNPTNLTDPQDQSPTQHFFLYTAVNPDGQSVTERIAEHSLDTARYTLEIRGYSAIVFHNDETDRALQKLAGVSFDEDELLAPKKDLASRTTKGVWGHLLFVFRSVTPLWVLLLLWDAYSLLAGPPYGWIARLGFLLSIFGPLYFLWKSLPGVFYQCLLDARV